MVNYFVSFSFTSIDGEIGFGNGELTMDNKILSFKDIILAQDKVLKSNKDFKSVSIINYIQISS